MKVVPTKQIEEAYKKRIVNTVIKPLQGKLVKTLSRIPINVDGWKNAISHVFNSFEYEQHINTNVPIIANDHINDVSDWHYKKIYNQFKALYDVDVRPLLNQYKTQEFLRPIINTNIFLIKTIPAELLSQVETHYSTIVRQQGFNQQTVANMLTSRFNVARSRSQLIARDQTSKTVGALNQYRQTQAGVNRFMWKTSEDERVRPEHRELDGKVFSWANPPSEGIPGHPINCRCYAMPILGHELIDRMPDKLIIQRPKHGNVTASVQQQPLIAPRRPDRIITL